VVIADLDSPAPGKLVLFIKPRLVLNDTGKQQVSPDGRFLTNIANTKIEVVDLRAAARGESASRIMDLLNEDELKAAEPVSAAEEPPGARWRAVE
jgi:hypothetical protein